MTAPAGCGGPTRATACGASSSTTATGNQTLTIESEGTNLADMTIDQVIADARAPAPVGEVYVDGVNATINVFDKRGLATQTRLPKRQLTPTDLDRRLVDSRTYNAFGEVTQETDARGYRSPTSPTTRWAG